MWRRAFPSTPLSAAYPSALLLALVVGTSPLALFGACRSPALPPNTMVVPHSAPGDPFAQARQLPLDKLVTGSTEGWEPSDGPGGDWWRFEATLTSSYLFTISGRAEHRPSIELHAITGNKRRTLGQTLDRLTLPLQAGVYYVNVDDNRVDRGPYALHVTRFEYGDSAIRYEDVNLLEPMCERASSLRSAVFGTFQSLPGGARTTCGGTGGNVVHVLELAAPARVTLRGAAQFEFSLDVRESCLRDKQTLVCAKSRERELAVSTELAAGRYFVVLDAEEVGSLDTGLPGAAVRGAYSLAAQVEPLASGAAP